VEGSRLMPKTFFSLGYNMADPTDLQMVTVKINNHEYSPEDLDTESFNLTSWWTPSMQTDISIKFKVRKDEISNDCALSQNDALFLTLFSYCPGTKLQHQAKPVAISDDEVEIELSIPANELADDLTLNAIVTANFIEGNLRKVGSPQLSNSRLLTKSWSFLLSGSRTQANVVFLDFSQDLSRAKSLWQIKISDNIDFDSWLNSQHSNILRIEVNEIHEDFIQQPHFQIPMMTDLVMLALDNAINDDEKFDFLQNDALADGTWARFVKYMYQSVFTVGQIGVKQKWIEEQDRIRTRVQHLMSSNLEIK
jgi:hypothetical protein